jgi:hypothetical protein
MIKLKSLFRRGQTPSGSKGPGGGPIKGASSVSSLDDNLSSHTKSTKSSKFGSKDKIDQIVYNKGSKEKLVDAKPKDKPSKRNQPQPPQPTLSLPQYQMPIQEQQDLQQYHLGVGGTNNGVMDQRSEPKIAKDQVDHFDGHKQQQQPQTQLEVSFIHFFFLLYTSSRNLAYQFRLILFCANVHNVHKHTQAATATANRLYLNTHIR